MFKYEYIKSERSKGKSLIDVNIADYTVIDIETTGFDTHYCSIIELSALKVRSNKVVSSFSELVQPDKIPSHLYEYENPQIIYIDDFISELTGITNEMLAEARSITSVLPEFIEFLNDDILVGHNVNFDINFIYDNFKKYFGGEFRNDYIDLLRISKKAYPECKNYKLKTIAEYLSVAYENAHRGLTDCKITFNCFDICKNYIITNNIDLSPSAAIDLRTISTDNTAFDTEHPLYGAYCVFTGTLDKMTRKEAAQIAVDFGAHCENNVTKKSNYLILGNNDFCKSIKNGKSNKQKKAEKLIQQGQDLKIITENIFYDMIFES